MKRLGCFCERPESEDGVDVIIRSKRLPIYKAFFYHATSRMGQALLERGEAALAGRQASIQAEVSFKETADELTRISSESYTAQH